MGILPVGMFPRSTRREPCFFSSRFLPFPVPCVCLNSNSGRVDFMSEMVDFFRKKACAYLHGPGMESFSSWNHSD